MADLHACLQAQHTALDSLITLLQQEQEQLIAGNVDVLPALVEQKQAQVEQVNALMQQVLCLMPAANPAQFADAMQQQPATVREVWQRVQYLARMVHELNRNNGQLIDTRLRLSQQRMNALKQASQQADIYGADGQWRALSSRDWGSA
jgi:flagella synthesis protein FlgN